MQKLLIIIFSSIIFSGCSIQNLFIKKPAGLEIATTPSATVFIDDENVGSTPYSNQGVKPGEYTIRLVPGASEDNFQAWETQVKLSSQTTTIINKSFAASNTESASYLLQLEPVPGGSQAFVSVISDPDTTNVSIDGQPHGFTPLTKIEVEPGSRTVQVSTPGFKPLSITINAVEGYNLIVNAKLARDLITIEQKEASPSADTTDPDDEEFPTPAPSGGSTARIAKPYVLITETGTGWLRVRSAPSSATDNELGKVDVGEKLPYFETNDTGWYKIMFEDQEGWISGKYATIYE